MLKFFIKYSTGFVLSFSLLSTFALSADVDSIAKPGPSKKCLDNTTKIRFHIANKSLDIGPQATVFQVYDGLTNIGLISGQDVALISPGFRGQFNFSKEAKDETFSQASFLCRLQENIDVELFNRMWIVPVSTTTPPKPRDTPKSQLTNTDDNAIKHLFKALSANVKTPNQVGMSGLEYALTTEIELGKIEPLLKGAPQGLFVTVGGDRAFRAAALHKNITGLLIFDLKKTTTRFTQINAKLLKAEDLAQYRHLRWFASFEEWKKFDASLTKSDFDFWRPIVTPSADDKRQQALSELLNRNQIDQKNKSHDRLRQAAEFLRFREGNYLFNEELFQNLRNLALHNQIFSITADLKDSKTVSALNKAFTETAVRIAVLDLDNLHIKDYIDAADHRNLVHHLFPFGVDTSLLIGMTNLDTKGSPVTKESRYSAKQMVVFGDYNVYLGFTFDYLRKDPIALDDLAIANRFNQHFEFFNENKWQDIKLFQ